MPRIELLHPMIVHFPIALFIGGVLFELLALFFRREFFQKLALANFTLAALGAIAAVIFGEIAANTIPHNETIHEIMETHELLGWITAGLFVIIALWNFFHWKRHWPRAQFLYWPLLIVAAGTITWGATLGGRMVFDQGAAVKPLYEVMESSEGGAGHHHTDGAEDADTHDIDHAAGEQEEDPGHSH